MELRKVYDELYGMIEDLKKQIAGGLSSSVDYETQVTNLPKVNNITLKGNKKSSDLKIAYSMTESEYAAATKNAESIYCLQENAATLTDSAYVNLEVADWTEVSGVYKQTKPFVFEITPATGWAVEDVSIETGIASIDSYEVTSDPLGLSITYAAETLPEYGITATVTVTVTQPAGATRIVKNGVLFGNSRTIRDLYSADASTTTYALSEPLSSFDAIEVLATYFDTYTSKNIHCASTFLTKTLLEHMGESDDVFGVTTDSVYTFFTVTDDTHLARANENTFFVTKITGIKY